MRDHRVACSLGTSKSKFDELVDSMTASELNWVAESDDKVAAETRMLAFLLYNWPFEQAPWQILIPHLERCRDLCAAERRHEKDLLRTRSSGTTDARPVQVGYEQGVQG